MPETIINVRNISHTFFDGYKALKNISLSIKKGEFIILAGRNGSGKSTLLKHLNGLLLPDTGSVSVNGLEVSKNLVPARKSVGMVFQDADTQIIGDTVFDETAFGLENLKFKRMEIDEKVGEILKYMKLWHLRDKSPSLLSGGEKRKLAIAGVLVMSPEVILFDEPFSNLDFSGSKQLLSILKTLKRSGRTIMIATHDVETIIFEATRVIIMDNAEIKADGPPEDMVSLLEKYDVREPCSSRFGFGLKPWAK